MIDPPDGLGAQIEEARLGHRARYILIAIIDGEEYDVGETVLGPTADVEATRLSLLSDIDEQLRKEGLSNLQISGATIRA